MNMTKSTRPVHVSSLGTSIGGVGALLSWLTIAVGLINNTESWARTIEKLGVLGLVVSVVVTVIAAVGLKRRNVALYGGDKTKADAEFKADRAELPTSRNAWLGAAFLMFSVVVLATLALPDTSTGITSTVCTVVGTVLVLRTGYSVPAWIRVVRWERSKPKNV